MSTLVPFYFGDRPVRVEIDAHGNPWWIAKDVCVVLGLKNVSNAVGRLAPGEKGIRQTDKDLIINESGLYRLIFRSDKSEARAFQTWVFVEVLPAIRKTGSYAATPHLPQVRDKTLQMIIDMAVQLDAARILAEEAKAEAAQASANAQRALESQLFFTVAEYVYSNALRGKLPESGYRACSDHLRRYCLDHGIPFRKIPVGGKPWREEYAFHLNVYTEALPAWLKRRFAQSTFQVVPLHQEDKPS